MKLFTAFHLNLMYSSIEVSQRPEVVERCYWPLLRLAETHGVPLGIEATALTLEAAAEADPAWLEKLRALIDERLVEFIGAGYAQVIAPLVPVEVTEANLRIGQRRYEELLGVTPSVGLVNEQAFSAGLVELYRDAGFEAIVMEWDNPAMAHPEWDREWRYLPQLALGQQGQEIPVLWNNSVAFQKFQRYTHGEIELDEYLAYLGEHVPAEGMHAFALYGNDVEIFDFRPGRFLTEATLVEGVEWERISVLFEALVTDQRFEFTTPSEVLALIGEERAGNRLHLESTGQPVPVKKQGKYNLTRWAVTPRDDLEVNTACWRIYERLRSRPETGEAEWEELCYLWSSDFRTHITEKRWEAFRERLEAFSGKVDADVPAPESTVGTTTSPETTGARGQTRVERDGRCLVLENEHVSLRLNTRRGLAIEALTFPALGPEPLVGTLAHGYYDDISLGADYYTGHITLEPPGVSKATDLEAVEPEIIDGRGFTEVVGTADTALGPVRKSLRVWADEAKVDLTYELGWNELPLGSLRLGYVTVFPTAFDRGTLYYATHNGGREIERFPVGGTLVEQGNPASSLVSASGGIGVTGGVVEIGDADRALLVEIDKTSAALIGLVSYREVRDSYIFRVTFSAFELDETARLAQHAQVPKQVRFTIRPAAPMSGARAQARL